MVRGRIGGGAPARASGGAPRTLRGFRGAGGRRAEHAAVAVERRPERPEGVGQGTGRCSSLCGERGMHLVLVLCAGDGNVYSLASCTGEIRTTTSADGRDP